MLTRSLPVSTGFVLEALRRAPRVHTRQSNVTLALLSFIALGVAPSPSQGASIQLLTCRAGSCGSVIGAGPLSYPGSGPGYSTIAEARAADFGTIGVRAQVSGNNVNGIETHASATVQDVLFFSGVSSGTVQYDFLVDASAQFSMTNGYIQLYLREGLPTNSSALVHELYFEGAGQLGFSHVPLTPLRTALTITKSFTSSSAAHIFTLTAVANCYTNTFQSICNGAGDIDALNTLTLSSIVVRDSFGNVVVNPGITSESGFDYSRPSAGGTAVPEPSSFALLGAGLLALAARRKETRVPTAL